MDAFRTATDRHELSLTVAAGAEPKDRKRRPVPQGMLLRGNKKARPPWRDQRRLIVTGTYTYGSPPDRVRAKRRAGETAGGLFEAGAGFGELAFLFGLLAEAQHLGVHVAFWPGVVSLPLHDPEPSCDVFGTGGDAVGEFPVEVAQAAGHVFRFPPLQLIGAPELREMGGSESRVRGMGPKNGNEVRIGIPDACVIRRHIL